MFDDGLGRNGGRCDGEAEPVQQVIAPTGALGRHQIEGAGDGECAAQAVGHCLAVEDRAVARGGLDAVADGMAEIERHPQPGLALVGRHYFALGPGAAFDHFGHAARLELAFVAARDRLAGLLDQLQQPLVAQTAHLHDFAEGGPELAGRQRGQQGDVGHEGDRLVEGADQVLALRQVHGRLAAEGGVDLADQRGGYLDDRHATQV